MQRWPLLLLAIAMTAGVTLLAASGCRRVPPGQTQATPIVAPATRTPVRSCADDLSGTWVAIDDPSFRYRISDRGRGLTIDCLFETAHVVADPATAPTTAVVPASAPAETLASYSTHVYHLHRDGAKVSGTLDFAVTSTRGKRCPVALTAEIDQCDGTITLWSDRGSDVTWANCKSQTPGQLNGTRLRRE